VTEQPDRPSPTAHWQSNWTAGRPSVAGDPAEDPATGDPAPDARPAATVHSGEGEPATTGDRAADLSVDAGDSQSSVIGHPAVDAALRALAEVTDGPPAEQLPAYQAAHRTLREVLAGIDEAEGGAAPEAPRGQAPRQPVPGPAPGAPRFPSG
jgi:hypothetical protein